ncbi:hypothetical protein ACFX2B_021611 [Malus domestica]
MWSRQPAGGQREEAQEPQNFTWVGEFGSRIRTFATSASSGGSSGPGCSSTTERRGFLGVGYGRKGWLG